MHEIKRIQMSIKGVVQGVGFRPFIYNLALSLNLKGWVNNTADGVELETEGPEQQLRQFIQSIRKDAPPLAMIIDTDIRWLTPIKYKEFVIKKSDANNNKFTLISPDVATCKDCLTEIKNPNDRRYRYPFTNCTNCGPRFTIIKDIPYDRSNTTMAEFPMCPVCQKEYDNPVDRRFHAQPNACPVCGPRVSLLNNQGEFLQVKDPITEALNLLDEGKILAIKGLGGYHLVCNGLDTIAVLRLRRKKNRDAKPFAVMMPDVETIKKYCTVSKEEEKILTNNARPIVLLRKIESQAVAEDVAPNNPYLGVMLPYTPLHHLLFDSGLKVLVMTSGNSSGEAIEYIDTEAIANLANIADYFLTHNRDIHIRTDDSVMRVFRNQEMILRRSRGYAPLPIKIPFKAGEILAVGGELKNTICLTKGDLAFPSQFIGDLESISNICSFEQSVGDLQKMFNIQPTAVAYDLHPNYKSSSYALDIPGLIKIPVQHHHAHIASCMAENGLTENVIGVAFDGTGYGLDGTVWGGEFFTGSYTNFERWAHIKHVCLLGGDAAIKEPWRMAVSYLVPLLGEEIINHPLPPFKYVDMYKLRMIKDLVIKWPNKVLTSSAGRLFDAVASLLGVRQEISYEGQAAIELEQLANKGLGDYKPYNFNINTTIKPWKLSLDDMLKQIVAEILDQKSPAVIAARFHQTIATLIVSTCKGISKQTGIKKVVLSGGVFQNILLTNQVVNLMEKEDLKVYTQKLVPSNDGGISLGQAAIAAKTILKGSDS